MPDREIDFLGRRAAEEAALAEAAATPEAADAHRRLAAAYLARLAALETDRDGPAGPGDGNTPGG